jgi:hypothetical protein
MNTTVPIPEGVLREGRRCFIALPWYRDANPLTTVALLHLFQRDRMTASISFGDAFIAHARNKLASKFLQTNFEWMLMLDSDMVPPCGNAAWFNDVTGLKLPEWAASLNTVERLISAGKTVIGATYFGRSPGRPPIFAEGIRHKDRLLRSGPVDQVNATRWVGTGCFLVHRSALTAIEAKFPLLSRDRNNGTGQWFTSSEHDLQQAVAEAIQLAEDGRDRSAEIVKRLTAAQHRSSVHSSLGMGEDVQFCVRATQSGHQPHVDFGLWAAHIGDAVYPRR